MMNLGKEVAAIIHERIGVEESKIVPEASFEDLGLDSLDAVEIFMSVEDKWDIEITDEMAGTWRSVQDIITDVEKLLE